jgi:hypothetical protein
MQDNYVGDVGDYGKYGLLSQILECSGGKVHLGVNWYKYEDQNPKKGDGKYTGYLDLKNENGKKFEQYRCCFPELYQWLRVIVKDEKRRKIAEIENNQVIGDRISFYSKPVNSPDLHHTQREEERNAWFIDSLESLKHSDIIFLDPDNGIQTDSLKKSHKWAGKYFFRDECRKYFASGKSLILYHHRNRKPKEKYDADIRKLHQAIDPSAKMFILRFKRFSVRDYIIIAQKEHEKLFGDTIRRLTESPCDFLFSEYQLSP